MTLTISIVVENERLKTFFPFSLKALVSHSEVEGERKRLWCAAEQVKSWA